MKLEQNWWNVKILFYGEEDNDIYLFRKNIRGMT